MAEEVRPTEEDRCAACGQMPKLTCWLLDPGARHIECACGAHTSSHADSAEAAWAFWRSTYAVRPS